MMMPIPKRATPTPTQSVMVGGILVGADAMSRTAGVPSYIAQVMVATSLLSMVSAIMLTRYRVRWR